jgi:hypothetical protein
MERCEACEKHGTEENCMHIWVGKLKAKATWKNYAQIAD